MSFVFLAASVVLFVACLKLFGVVPQVRRVIEVTRGATASMASRTLSEEEKEAAVRQAAVQAFARFCSITLRVALTLALPFLLVAAGSAMDLYTTQQAIEAASDWVFIVAASIAMVAALAVVR